MRNGFLGLRGREERRAKREYRQELIDLRMDNPSVPDEQFKTFAVEAFENRYDGIDGGRLRQILDLVLFYLPRILALFAALQPQPQAVASRITESNGNDKVDSCDSCGEPISVGGG